MTSENGVRGSRHRWMRYTVESEIDRLADWTRHLTRGMDREVTRKTLRAVALEFARRVIRRTPVDTGRARGGWTAVLDANGVPLPSGEGVAQGRSESQYTETDRRVEVVNGVPYIVRLEYGHSRQAPAGMVRITIAEITGEVVPAGIEQFENLLIAADRRAGLR